MPLRVILGLGLLISIAAGYGYIVYKQVQTRTDVRNLTRVIEGTPGPQGQPGLGIDEVKVLTVAPDRPAGARKVGQTLYLRIPRGDTGKRGPVGPIGGKGPKGEKGEKGNNGSVGPVGPSGSISQKKLMAAVNSFLRSHTLRCELKIEEGKKIFICRVQ